MLFGMAKTMGLDPLSLKMTQGNFNVIEQGSLKQCTGKIIFECVVTLKRHPRFQAVSISVFLSVQTLS